MRAASLPPLPFSAMCKFDPGNPGDCRDVGILLFSPSETKRLFHMAATLSFPPLLSRNQWKGTTSGAKFPGGDHTWKKSLRPRPLRTNPNAGTIEEIAVSTGKNFKLLSETTGLRQRTDTPSSEGRAVAPSTRGEPRLFHAVFPDAEPPTFKMWDYCRKHGHAPDFCKKPGTASIPAPRINDLSAWFSEYGRPRVDVPPGYHSEFTAVSRVGRAFQTGHRTSSAPRSSAMPTHATAPEPMSSHA